jgi:hypothetical protein
MVANGRYPLSRRGTGNDGTCGSCKNTTLDCLDGAPRSCVNGSWEPGTPRPDGQSCSEGRGVCDDDEPYTTLVRHPLLGCGQKWVDPSEPGYEWIVFSGTPPVHIDVSQGLAWTNGVGSTDQAGAAAACASMVRGGLSGWRLPTFDEGRRLLAGCTSTSPGGPCPLSSSCLAQICNDGDLCTGCQAGHGPNAGSYQHAACQFGAGYFHTSSFCSDCAVASTRTVYAPNAVVAPQPTATLRNPICVHAAPADLL